MSCTAPEDLPQSSRVLDAPTVLFLLAALVFLYFLLFFPPFTPIEHLMDGWLSLAPGQRMYEGEMIYRDIFEFMTPGTALVYFFLFKIFGLRLWIPNLLSLLLGLGLAWIGVVISKKLIGPRLCLLPSAIFLAGVYKNNIDPTHHWFSMLTATAAIAVMLDRQTTARIATAGFLCGLTACFTQTRGLAAVVGFAVFLWWESQRRQEDRRGLLKKQAWLIASFLATLLAVNGYFIWKAGLARFLWCTVVFNLKYYPRAGANTFWAFREALPAFTSLSSFLLQFKEWLFIYVVIPFSYLLFFGRYRRDSNKRAMEFWERPMLLATVGAFLLLSIAPAAGRFRMAVSALPGIILLVWFIDSPRRLARILAAVLAVGVMLVVPFAVRKAQIVESNILTTPQGKLAVTYPGAYEQYTWIQAHTRPSEYIYETAWADVYFCLDLRNPTPLPRVETNGYTTPEQVAEVIRGLEQHQVHYILWSADQDLVTEEGNRSADPRGPLRDYVHSRYQRVKLFADSVEVWERIKE